MEKMKAILKSQISEECLTPDTEYSIVRLKRDMTLSLNSIDDYKHSKYIVDETPTPTRLIRNCEEIGLFDDLNPFEQTFRQAINNKSKPSTNLLATDKSTVDNKCNDEDTLHTPNIFPFNSVAVDSKKTVKTGADIKTICDSHAENDLIVQSSDGVKEFDKKHATMKNKECRKRKSSKEHQTVEKPQNDDTTLQTVFRKIYPKPVVVPIVRGILTPTKEKILQSLLKSQSQCKNKQNEADVPIVNVLPQTADGLDVELLKTKNIQQKVRKRTNMFKDNESNERNREAAKRYRNKQKLLHDALLKRNEQLESENAQLKKQLQSFLKAHQDCLITQSNCNTLFYK